MKSIFCLLLAALATSANAASYPVMECVNEEATKGECSAEVKEVIKDLASWFDPYIKNSRRHLLDCSRFCDSSIKYFTLQLPCDCVARRMLSPKTEAGQEREMQSATSALHGPIQLFEAITASMTPGHCKDVLSKSKCIVSFVKTYTYKSNVLNPTEQKEEILDDKAQDEKDAGSYVDLEPVSAEVYNPVTGEHHAVDPVTGDTIEQPTGGHITMIDPITGEEVPYEP